MPTYSHSKIESFRHCPRKYYYRYVAKVELPEAPEQIATFLGSRVHDAFEYLYGRVAKGVVPSTDALKEHFEAEWAAKWTDAVVIHDRDATADEYRAIGWQCIDHYYQRFHPFNQAIVVGLEQMIFRFRFMPFVAFPVLLPSLAADPAIACSDEVERHHHGNRIEAEISQRKDPATSAVDAIAEIGSTTVGVRDAQVDHHGGAHQQKAETQELVHEREVRDVWNDADESDLIGHGREDSDERHAHSIAHRRTVHPEHRPGQQDDQRHRKHDQPKHEHGLSLDMHRHEEGGGDVA